MWFKQFHFRCTNLASSRVQLQPVNRCDKVVDLKLPLRMPIVPDFSTKRYLLIHHSITEQHDEICLGLANWCFGRNHDNVIKWEHFPRYWPFVRETTSDGWFPSQRPVMRGFDVFFDLRLNKRLSKQSRRRWYKTPSHSLWRHCNERGFLRDSNYIYELFGHVVNGNTEVV